MKIEPKDDQDVTGAATSSEVQPGKPDEQDSEDILPKHSREKEEGEIDEEEGDTPKKKLRKKKSTDDEADMDSDDSTDDSENVTGKRRRTNYICFKPLMYYNRQLDMHYYFRYFKPYKYDHRLLEMGHDCGCPPRRPHKTRCAWYNEHSIYLIDIRADLSISEKAAQHKIYKFYMETQNNLPDECGCGTVASIFYMGHSTSCDDFKHVHERESHEVLLAILNRKKKLSFDAEFDPRHHNYEVQADAEAVLTDDGQVKPILDVRGISSEGNNNSLQAESLVAKNVTSVTNPPSNPPNPSSISDIPLVKERKPGEKPKDDEMPPLVDISDDPMD